MYKLLNLFFFRKRASRFNSLHKPHYNSLINIQRNNNYNLGNLFNKVNQRVSYNLDHYSLMSKGTMTANSESSRYRSWHPCLCSLASTLSSLHTELTSSDLAFCTCDSSYNPVQNLDFDLLFPIRMGKGQIEGKCNETEQRRAVREIF